MNRKLKVSIGALVLGAIQGGFHQFSIAYDINLPFDILILAIFLRCHIKGISHKHEALQYLLFGVAYYAVVLNWIPGTLIVDLEWGRLLGILGTLFVSCVASLQLVLIPVFRRLVRKLGINNFIAEISVSALFVHSFIPSIVGGFQIGCFVLNSRLLIDLSDVIGLAGIAGVVFFFSSSLAVVMGSLCSPRQLLTQLIYPITAVVIMLCLNYLQSLVVKETSEPREPLSVAFLNDDSNRQRIFSSKFQEELRIRRHLSAQFRITEDYFNHPENYPGHQELVIWPQGSLEIFPDIKIRQEFEQLVNGINRPIFFGAYIPAERARGDRYQHTGLVGKGLDGEPSWSWRRKELTIPFVETQAPKAIPFIVAAVRELSRTFTLGVMGSTSSQALKLTDNNQGLVIDSIMCYEALFSNFVRAKVSDDSDLMILTTNDNWWSHSKLTSRLMILATQLRARENGIFIARTSQAGGNYLISPEGKVVTHISYKDKKSSGRVTFEPYRVRTAFRIVGPTYVCLGLIFGMLFILRMVDWAVAYYERRGSNLSK